MKLQELELSQKKKNKNIANILYDNNRELSDVPKFRISGLYFNNQTSF